MLDLVADVLIKRIGTPAHDDKCIRIAVAHDDAQVGSNLPAARRPMGLQQCGRRFDSRKQTLDPSPSRPFVDRPFRRKQCEPSSKDHGGDEDAAIDLARTQVTINRPVATSPSESITYKIATRLPNYPNHWPARAFGRSLRSHR